MRYLNSFFRKKFKKVEITEDVIDNIKEICFDITEKGFFLFTSGLKKDDFKHPSIDIVRGKEKKTGGTSLISFDTYDYKDIEETVDRIVEYMKWLYYKPYVQRRYIEKDNKFLDVGVKIIFK